MNLYWKILLKREESDNFLNKQQKPAIGQEKRGNQVENDEDDLYDGRDDDDDSDDDEKLDDDD